MWGSVKVIVTIDTEADDQWSGVGKVETRNLEYLPRFQRLCEAFGMKPSYLCTYEIAAAAGFTELAAFQKAGTAEVGAHLHPWTTPPFTDPTAAIIDRSEYPAYPSELPLARFRAKLVALTELLRRRTGNGPTSYRAGRFGFSAEHIDVLLELGYTVDCSVTPLVDRSTQTGVAACGPDYRAAPARPYMLDARDICKPGGTKLFELPVTILYTHPAMRNSARVRWLFDRAEGLRLRGLVNRVLNLSPSWFRPYPEMTPRRFERVHDVARELGLPMIEMMLHSSELMPGGSRLYRTAQSVDRLYGTLHDVFAYLVRKGCTGVTLSEFAQSYAA